MMHNDLSCLQFRYVYINEISIIHNNSYLSQSLETPLNRIYFIDRYLPIVSLEVGNKSST